MMILFSSPPSPFGRKVKIAAALLALSDRITIEMVDANAADTPLPAHNPLGKIPTLRLEDGSALFDSRVILEYFDHLAGGGRIIPREAAPRFAALRLQALCDGLLDAALLQVYERRFRPEMLQHQPWLDRQAGKVARTLAHLEQTPQTLDATPHVGQIALACALGYLDLRFQSAWRAQHPRLVQWLDGFAAQVPAFAATRAS